MFSIDLPEVLANVEQVTKLEQLLIQRYGISQQSLMHAAGMDSFELMCQIWPDANRIAVFCGAGNNAGDGYVLAQQAHQMQFDVTVYYLTNPEQLNGAARAAAEACRNSGVTLTPFKVDDQPFELDVDVIVDAILGTGLKREVTGEFAKAIHLLNTQPAVILALDIPSGLNADTGARCGVAIEADVTISFLSVKQGLLTADGLECCGTLVWSDLNVPAEALDCLAETAVRILEDEINWAFLPRRVNTNKGHFGHVLVVGGNYGMPGSVCLAGNSALIAGAGMVSVATRPEHVTTIVGHRPEIMCHGVTQANELESLCARASVIVLGPGLGQDMWAQDLWHYVTQLDIPMVVDADGLNLLSRNPCQKTQWVLTPHPGEAARLLGVEVADIQNDRFTAAQQLQQLFCGTVVLKGAGSIVSAAQEPTYVCYAGNPGMAAAGMGDLLTGIIAAFIAQGLPITRATYLATMVHAKAGDLAALKYGERGLLASELLPFTRQIINNKVKQDDYDEE